MNPLSIRPKSQWVIVASLLFFVRASSNGAQYVDLNAQIETVFWYGDRTRSCSRTVRCVVGTNMWMIEPEAESHQRVAWLFDGLQLTGQTVITGYPTKYPELFKRNHPEFELRMGAHYTSVIHLQDGSPFHPVRVADVPWSVETKVCWFAFCSGSFLKRESRRLFPPIDEWKEHLSGPVEFSDKTDVFEDDLGLPRRIELFTTSDQPVFQYTAGASTSVLGWNLPTEFYMVQYRPFGTNGWQVYMTARGKVSAVDSGVKPEFSKESH